MKLGILTHVIPGTRLNTVVVTATFGNVSRTLRIENVPPGQEDARVLAADTWDNLRTLFQDRLAAAPGGSVTAPTVNRLDPRTPTQRSYSPQNPTLRSPNEGGVPSLISSAYSGGTRISPTPMKGGMLEPGSRAGVEVDDTVGGVPQFQEDGTLDPRKAFADPAPAPAPAPTPPPPAEPAPEPPPAPPRPMEAAATDTRPPTPALPDDIIPMKRVHMWAKDFNMKSKELIAGFANIGRNDITSHLFEVTAEEAYKARNAAPTAG